MPDDRYETNRVLGMPWPPGTRARQGQEPQRVMGFPVDWFGRADVEWFRSIVHPVRTYRRWVRRRRLGPYAVDDDET
jgi:hypothetical protein